MTEPEKKTSLETSGSTGLSDSNSEEIQGDEYPTQHHAGKVGLGPQCKTILSVVLNRFHPQKTKKKLTFVGKTIWFFCVDHKGESMIDKVKGLTHKLVGKGKDDEHELRSDQDQGFGELGLGNTGSQKDGIQEVLIIVISLSEDKIGILIGLFIIDDSFGELILTVWSTKRSDLMEVELIKLVGLQDFEHISIGLIFSYVTAISTIKVGLFFHGYQDWFWIYGECVVETQSSDKSVLPIVNNMV
ncbi:uncharacterized protein MELLADRAFT_106929 [Melampsora larici-populina 98AG31]|uniref:Uncharacterized protein n=1 Tax=Melampsora larici-populina (strain 98AG31 / pathotype 3-4-7) TaxID=747676 RepID=F4RN37_MELLP|nr:uncharacterized protein MELLADRAFT_106929 [Melampsora larici-populina 98AG31]EGG06230.1 hypothetical protein MELLADRAFT_106929 [Melampsora larici-populina 98AG31]